MDVSPAAKIRNKTISYKKHSNPMERKEDSMKIKNQINDFIQQENLEEEEKQFEYSRGQLIGQGAYGKVYQGLDISSG